MKFPNLFAKAKNENESQESEDDRFHRSKTFRAFAFGGCSDSNVPPNERAKFFSERWISFSLSVKSVKTRTAFLPDLGSILPYFEGKKGGVLESQLGEKKQTTKIHHRFKASHYRERLLSDLTFTDSFIKHSLFTGPLLSCKHHSIDHKETTNAEGVCRCQGDCPVSYTHLTLPTIRMV